MNQEIQSFELTELFSSLPKSVRSPCKNEYIVSADDELQILNTDELKTTEAEKGLIKSIWCDDKVRLLTQSKELFQGFLNRVISVENQNKETELLDRSIVSKLLHLCCMFDAVDCSSALINGEFGTVPLVNEMDDTGRSALHKAAEVHASRCIELLLRKRARTDVKTKNGGSQLALELSLSSRRMDVVWNVDDPIEDLLVCLNQKDLTAVRLLAETTKDVAQVAFTIAMEGQVVSLAALLMVCAERVISSMVVIQKDANRVYKEKTVYDCVIREALSLGQIITPSTAGDGTCAETDTDEIVEKRKLLLCEMELLQLYGAVAQSVSIDKKVTSQLIRASQAGDEAVVKLLLAAKMDVNDTDVEGNSALHWCVKTPTGLASKQIGVICLLIKHGARVNQRNKLGFTALHFAAASGNIQAIQILLSQDPDGVNAYNEMKETPLFVAVKNDYIDCVELLLCCGANNEVLNIRKQRPIDFAKSQDMRFMLSPANIDFLNRAFSNQQKQKDGVVSETRMDEDTIVEKKWPKTKTEICKYFESSTGCVRGAKCFYAHGQEELRPKQGMQPTEDRIVEEYKRKIFVGGLPPTVYSDTLGKYFEHFGSMEDAKVIGVKTENNQVQSRGFGFVTFKNEKSVLAAVQAHYMTIMGKPVEIKTAFSRSQLLKEYMQNLLPPEEQEEEYYNPVVVECETPNSSEKRSLKLQEEEMCTTEQTEQMSWADKLLLTQPKTSSIESSSQTHLTPTSDDKSQPAWLCTFKKWFPKFLKEVYKRYGKGEWYPLSSVKADFRITCGQELDHVSLGYPKLSEFMKSLPGICRMQTVPVNGREPASHMVLLPNLTKRKLITPIKILQNPSKAKSVDEKGDGSSDDSKVPSKVNTDSDGSKVPSKVDTDSDGSKVPSKVDTDSDGSKFLQDVLSVSYENIEEKKNVPLEIPKVILDEKDDFPYCVPTRFLQFLEPDPLFHGRPWLRNQRGTEDIFGGRGMGRHLVLEALSKRRKNTSVFFLREYDFYQDYKASLVRRKCFGCGKGKMVWACFPCEHLLWCSECKLHAIKAAGIYVHKCVICDAKVERYCAIPSWYEKYSQMYDEYYEVPQEKELPPIDSFYMQVKKKAPFLGY